MGREGGRDKRVGPGARGIKIQVKSRANLGGKDKSRVMGFSSTSMAKIAGGKAVHGGNPRQCLTG